MLISKKTYVDIPFFITKNVFTGDINLVKDLNAIKSCLKHLILSNMGERPFNTALGTKVYGSQFLDTGNFMETTSLRNSIVRSIYDNDSRIDTVNVIFTKTDNIISVEVKFKLKNTNTTETVKLDIT